MKKTTVAAIVLAGVMALAAGCGAKEQTAANKDGYTIGISQFAEHGSLDNCRTGFLKGLAEEGIVEGENLEVSFQNSQADTGTASQIADNFISQKVDMICAIATPSAAAAYTAAMKTDVPVIYTAVSDPVAAGLAKEDGSPVGEITGTSDKLPVEAQLQMIREILPDAKTIGIMYTTSETNSEATLKEYEALVGEYGFELVTAGISNSSEIALAADNLIAQVDCLNNLTDNTVVQGLPTILEKANAAGIPVFGSEQEQVKVGCLAAVGLDYEALGVQTGKMAAKVLKGEAKASELNFELISEFGLYLNTQVAENLQLTLDEAYVGSALEVYDTISAE
ncbi:MAG: ABC transporter substrate-binding protein [Lachnospiraceae bacterium]|nr:ABC transporter substrate-binding protein [Lachnospiraceae bacterium]